MIRVLAADTGSTASVTLATPPEWRVLGLESLEDIPHTRSQIAARLDAVTEGEDLATLLAELAGGCASSGIIFAAMSTPGEGESLDLSTVTLALKRPVVGVAHQPVEEPDHTSTPTNNSAQVRPEPGPSQNAVALPAGHAARNESFELIDVGPPLSKMPVFCVEYAVAVPEDERVAVLTFTTIAPSDIEGLRAQFSDIASTLAFR